MNSISDEEVKSLDPKQLTDLLRILLFLEKRKHSFPNCYINVPRNITAPDGGEDGRLKTTDRKNSDWIIKEFCIFQCKATPMSDENCKSEMFKSGSKKLKPQIEDAINNGAGYILLASKDSVAEGGIDKRVEKIREAIKEAKIEQGISEDEAVRFSNGVEIRVRDANVIASWTNEHFPAVVFVQKCNGITIPEGLLDWDGLKSYKQNQNEFYTNDELNNVISVIQGNLNSGKHIRIEGSSGIGKTRLICEALSPTKYSDKEGYDETLKKATLYKDLANGSGDLLNFVKSHIDSNMILVLDNCSPKSHDDFLNECNREDCKIKLVTIDYEKTNPLILSDYNIIDLKDEYYESITADVLNNKYRGVLSDQDINYLIKFSEGNTKMAIDFAEASIREVQLNQTLNLALIEKLIAGRERVNEDEFNVLKILSAFRTFGYPDRSYYNEDREKYNSLLENVNFISEYFRIEVNKIKKIIDKYIAKGSIERRGNLIMLRPTPLALKLSLLFWNDLPIEQYTNFIESVPNRLREEVTYQLQQVGNVDEAKEIITTIWGVDGNFSTAEMLNSNSGSLLFRSIVNVNPIETVKVLKKHYYNKSSDDLRKVVEGRQNLVWSLERLCFRKETFNDAAKILMSFAVAEIETYYSNNSTSYFRQLFKIQLAGTEVDYDKRIEILHWALGKKDKEFDVMSIRACESAINNTANYRTIGAEYQGSKLPLKDYRPKSLEEVHEYINKILEILQNLYSDNQILVNQIIKKSLLFFVEYEYDFNRLRFFLDKLSNDSNTRHEFRQSLKRVTDFKLKHHDQIEIINEYLLETSPKSIEEKINDIVSKPEYIFDKDGGENIMINKCNSFAEEIVKEKIDLRNYLDNLLIGDQYQTFHFGKKYGELIGYDETLVNDIYTFLNNLNEGKYWNLSFLHGYLSAFSVKIRKSVFIKFSERNSKFSFILFRSIEPSLEDSLRLIKLLRNGLDSKFLKYVSYELPCLNLPELLHFLDDLNPLLENKSPVVDIIYHYLRKNNSIMYRIAIFEWLNNLMTEHNLIESIKNNREVRDYEWTKTMNLMLLTNDEYSSIISQQIISYHKDNFSSIIGEHFITEVALETLKVNFESSWANYSQLLLDRSKLLVFSVIFNLGFSGSQRSHPLFSDEERNNKIFNWCSQNQNTAELIIRFSPLYSEPGKWFAFTKRMIQHFWNEEGFLGELSSNLHSMTTVGSRVPYLESRKKLLLELLELNIPELTDWCNKEISYFNKEISAEKIVDAEEGLR